MTITVVLLLAAVALQDDSVMNAFLKVTLLTIAPGQMTVTGPTEENLIEVSGVITAKEAGLGVTVETKVACVIGVGETDGGEKDPGLAVGHHEVEEVAIVIPKGDGVIVVVAAAVGAEVEATAAGVVAAEALMQNATTTRLDPPGRRRKTMLHQQRNTTRKPGRPMQRQQTNRGRAESAAIAAAVGGRRKRARDDPREAAVVAEVDQRVLAVDSSDRSLYGRFKLTLVKLFGKLQC